MAPQPGFQKILQYFPDLSPEQHARFESLDDLYRDWNSKINVISRKNIDELYVNHVLHSMGIARIQEFLPGSDILDVGTGGGFPGIPLAILYPQTNFHLVDSIGKKIHVVEQIASQLKLTNITARHARAEEVSGPFDFIISRAVTKIGPFYQWVKKKFRKESNHTLNNGILYLKGGDLKDELLESKLRYKLFDLSKEFKEPFFETKKVLYIPAQ